MAQFKKTGGRKLGVPNKRTTTLIEVLNEHEYSPVADLIAYSQLAKKNYELAADPKEAADWMKIGVQCASSLIPYVYPKRKPIEGDITITPEEAEILSTRELIDLTKRHIEDLEN